VSIGGKYSRFINTLSTKKYIMSKQTIIMGEYDSLYEDLVKKTLISCVTGPKKAQPLTDGTIPVIPQIIGGHGGLHHYGFIDIHGDVWVSGENRNNIALNGITGYVDLVHIGVGNAKQLQCYNNGAGSDRMNNGVAILTQDGKIILVGSTESGFRNDGSPGVAIEPTPFFVPGLPVVTKIAVGGYFYALGADGVVHQWGGTVQDPYWRSFSAGRYGPTISQDFTIAAVLPFPEPIVDIAGGGDMALALGASGTLYGWAYRANYIGVLNTTLWGQKVYNLTQLLKLPTNIKQIGVGTEACYVVTTDGLAYSWGNNTQAACGNGQEGNFNNQTTPAPWGPQDGVSVYVGVPYLMNSNPVFPAGTKINYIWAGIGDVFYYFLEDQDGAVWAGGRNKGRVIPDGKNTGTSQENADFPNRWDVLSPEKLTVIPMPAPVVVPPPVNKQPVATIAPVPAVMLPSNLVSLDGSGSIDPDGQIAAFAWSQISGPIAAIIGAGSKVQVLVSAPGTYVFQLTVTDNQGATNAAHISLLVGPVPAPRVAATITLPIAGQTVTLSAAGVNKITYTDGSIQ
jgi:hypothetical protein